MTFPATVSTEQFRQANGQTNSDLIDVRTPIEFREVHAKSARNVPLDSLDPDAVIKSCTGLKGEPIYVICKGGTRGARAQKKFNDAGFTNVVNIEGGTDAWVSAGLPVVRGKKAISLERQVRIAAGFIVLSGAVAAMVTGNVYFAGIPAFVGAGLMFAGFTDSCIMGMLIAKMPWNRVKDDGVSCTINRTGLSG